MAEFAGHPGGSANDLTGLDHTAAETGTDDRRHRRPAMGIAAEQLIVGVQRRRVAVVVVDHGKPEVVFDRGSEVESTPGRLREIGGAACGDDPAGAGRTGRVEPHRPDCLGRCSGGVQDQLEQLADRFERGVRPLADPAGRFDHPIDEESAAVVEHGGVGLGATDVEADDDSCGPLGWGGEVGTDHRRLIGSGGSEA